MNVNFPETSTEKTRWYLEKFKNWRATRTNEGYFLKYDTGYERLQVIF